MKHSPHMRRGAAAASALLFVVLGSCGPKGSDKQATASTAPAGSPGTTHPEPPQVATGMTGMRMTGDPNHDFLRMMSDHHKGLIALAHETMEAPRGTAQSRADATRLDAKEDEELKQMVTLLDKDYKDPYEPKVLPAHQAMLDTLLTQSGAAYAATFYRDVVAHHREALATIDEYLSKAKHPSLKAMAEQMKHDRTREIVEFERKAGKP